MKHIFGESMRTLSEMTRMESLSHIGLLFVIGEVQHLPIYHARIRPEPTHYYKIILVTRLESDTDIDYRSNQ